MNSAELSPTLPEESDSLDLFGRVRALGYEGERVGQLIALVGALSLHVVFGGAAARYDRSISGFAEDVATATLTRLRSTVEIETAPEVPKVEEPPAPEPEPEKLVPPPDAPIVTEAPTEAPVAAAAQAAEVLTQAPDPNEPLDLTGEGFVSGTGSRFAGGTTMANGTATTAVRATVAAPIGVVGAKGTAAPVQVAPKESKARSAMLAPGALDLLHDCPFPAEADLENINLANVTLVVTLGSDGTPKSISVAQESHAGFGRAAKRCVFDFGKRLFLPALDDSGKPLDASTWSSRIRFQRR